MVLFLLAPWLIGHEAVGAVPSKVADQVVALAASTMTFVLAWGWEIMDRWEAGTSVICARIASAIACCSDGTITW
jgi:hypothetical protein